MAGEVIYLQGSGFGTSPHVQYSFNDSNWASLVPLTSNNQALTVQFPASLSRLPDLIAIKVSPDGNSWSAPVYMNQAKAFSFDTNQVAPGNSFRIFGRNLMFSRTPSVRLVDLADGSSHPASVNTSAGTAYEVAAWAPADIQPYHVYSVYVSNGYNGNAGSGGEVLAAATLSGQPSGGDYFHLGVPWASDINYTQNVYNVQNDPRLSQHASGYGAASDAAAINNAIWTASNAGGGIVYLPAGTYNLYFATGCGITLLPRVALMGAGASSTFINFGFGAAPGPGQGGYAVCFGTSRAGISDITFNNVNQSGHWPQSAAGLNGNEIFLQRTHWNIGTAQWVVIQNASNVTVQNSTIIQGLDPSYNGPISLIGSSNFVVRGNTIQYVAGALEFDQSSNGVFENNTVIRDASQSAPPYVVTHVLVGNFANNLMVLGNSFNVSGGTLAQRNDGETIGSESGGATRYDEFRGTLQGAWSNAIYDGSQNFNYSNNNAVPNLRAGATLAIVSGQGAGQRATVTGVSADGHTVYVNKPWTIVPAAGSAYATFDWGAANWIIAGNSLANNEKGIEFFDASIRDILITDNTLTNNGEILLSPTEQPNGAGLFNLVVNTEIVGNNLVDNNGLRPAAISAVPREDFQTGNFGTAILGLEILGNSITGAVPNTILSNTNLDDSKALSEGINLYWQWQTLGNFVDGGIPSLLATIVQGNTLTNSVAAFELNSGSYQTVLANNVTNHVGRQLTDTILPGISHASVSTVIPGVRAAVASGGATPGTTGPQLTVFGGSGLWTTQQAGSNATTVIQFGTGGTPIPGDYDGDGLTDCAVFLNGVFFVRPSSSPGETIPVYFSDPTDLPAPGDYDGDGKTDIAALRPSTGQWFYTPSSSPGSPAVTVQTLAKVGDVPLSGDYDGDGKSDFAFYRPSTATFYQLNSLTPWITYQTVFGIPGDLAVPADYDGDGLTDLAIYRPSTGYWYYRPSSRPYLILTQVMPGQPGDVPVPGDFDGDGKADFAIWRPSTQTWYLVLSSNPGVTVTAPMSGTGSAIPLSQTPNESAGKSNLLVN